MNRNAATIVLAAAMLVALAGCATQDALELPDLGPAAHSGAPPSPFYSPYYGHGFSYGYGSGYRPGYDPYYNYYYGGADPRYYYGPGVVYVPYPRYVPVPCADANQDGRCDKRPRDDGNDHDGDGGQHGDLNDGRDNGGKRDVMPRRPDSRYPAVSQGDGPRLRDKGGTAPRNATGTAPRMAPAPRAVPPAPRPVQAQPRSTTRRAAPPPPVERGPRVAPGRAPATGDAGAPQRRPD